MEGFWDTAKSYDEIDAWDDQYQRDAGACWKKMMKHWLDGGGEKKYPPTWEGLYDLLMNFLCKFQ